MFVLDELQKHFLLCRQHCVVRSHFIIWATSEKVKTCLTLSDVHRWVQYSIWKECLDPQFPLKTLAVVFSVMLDWLNLSFINIIDFCGMLRMVFSVVIYLFVRATMSKQLVHCVIWVYLVCRRILHVIKMGIFLGIKFIFWSLKFNFMTRHTYIMYTLYMHKYIYISFNI